MQNNEEFVKLKVYRCLRCEWEWASRKVAKPQSCARCKSKNWEVAKVEKGPTIAKGGIERTYKRYNFDSIIVGETVNFPWLFLPSGDLDQKANSRRYISLTQYGRRAGKVFRTEANVKTGLTVTRIS